MLKGKRPETDQQLTFKNLSLSITTFQHTNWQMRRPTSVRGKQQCLKTGHIFYIRSLLSCVSQDMLCDKLSYTGAQTHTSITHKSISRAGALLNPDFARSLCSLRLRIFILNAQYSVWKIKGQYKLKNFDFRKDWSTNLKF